MPIKSRLILGFGLAAFLPLLLLAVFTIFRVVEFIEINTAESLQRRAELIAPEFDSFIDKTSNDIKVLTQSDVFESGDALNISRYLNEVTAEIPGKTEIYYFDIAGNEMARSGSITRDKINITDLGVAPSLFEEALGSKQGSVFFADILSTKMEEKYLLVLSPVTDDDNLVIIGVLSMKVPLLHLSKLMNRVRANIGTDRVAYLIDKNGDMLMPPPSRSIPAKMDGFSVNKVDRNVEQEIVEQSRQLGTFGRFIRTGSGGQKELVVFHEISSGQTNVDGSWLMVIRAPWNSIIAPSLGLTKEIAILALVAIVIAIFAGIWMSRAFTIPLAKITASASTLMQDNVEIALTTIEPINSGPKELVFLSHALSRSIGHVASRTHDLEIARQAAEDARDEAERANMARAAFLAIMSHEIRTPLNGMLGMIQLLELNPDLSDQQAEYLGLARAAGESLLQILTDVLDLSKIESEAFNLEETEFSIDEIIAPVLSIHKLTTSDAIRIQHNCLIGEYSRFLGDPIRLRQIMWNLIGNAVKFTPEGSVNIESKIIAKGETSRVILSVTISDTGVGIKEADKQKILEPFNQADTSLTRSFEGVGLGLTIVQKLLSVMNGELSIVSIVDKGTVVSVDIPMTMIEQDENLIGENSDNFEKLNKEGQFQSSVLVVDDNKLNAMVASEMLKKSGFQTFVASGGREALEILNHHMVEFVVLDQHMPVMDGTLTSAAIRKHANESVSTVKIIGLTADAREVNKEVMRKAGMNIILTKPVRLEALLLAISNLATTKTG